MDKRDVLHLNPEVEKLRNFAFFQSVFSTVSDPEEIAHLLLAYKNNPKECPLYKTDVRSQEDAIEFGFNLLICINLFIKAYSKRDFVQPLMADDPTEESLKSLWKESDVSLLEKLKNFDINPMALRFVSAEDMPELSVQLNDCESKETVLGTLLDAALKSFAQKWETKIDITKSDEDLSNCIQDYLNRILTLKAIPVNEEKKLVIGIGYLDEITRADYQETLDPNIKKFKKIRSIIVRTIKDNIKNLGLSVVEVIN